jgi:hypothetical protein
VRYYVTLFDSNYLIRGLIMYRSLLRHGGYFHLWIICFDDLAYKILDKLNLDKVTLVPLSQFEDPDLLSIKSQRTRQEYCWTCTPSTLLYVLNTEPHVDVITYLDADLMFFSSIEPIFEEAKDASILLTEHRYILGFDISKNTGIYNVQFMMFRRDNTGLAALAWWRDRCIEWCLARVEDNKFGDQKYLDGWKEKYQGVHILQHLGGGLAPWNAAQYKLKEKESCIYVEKYPLIFYHFHGLNVHPFNIFYLSPKYPINLNIRELIYYPYLQEINFVYSLVREIEPNFNSGIVWFKIPRLSQNLYLFLRDIRATLNDIKQGKYHLYA